MRKLKELRGFVAYLLHPPNGYLLPLAVLVAAMPLGVIAFHYQREASIKFDCAAAHLDDGIAIADKYGLKPYPVIGGRNGAGNDFCRRFLQ